MPIYWKIIRMIKTKDKYNFRMELVRYAKEHSVSEAARAYQTTRKTVRKWQNRYLELGPKGLLDRSRAPVRVNNKMNAKEEKKILELRDRYPRWGAWRLKDRCDLNRSEGAIYRVLKQNGRIKKKKKKWQVQVDLREVKARLKPFEQIQWDTKDLVDIPSYYKGVVQKRLPRYQYTARDVRTGTLYISYGHKNNSTNMASFARYVLEHLKSNGVDVACIMHQSDNGAEFQKTSYKKEPGAFESVVTGYGGQYRTIPPRHCTWQSDVEISHRLIEDELYSCESFESQQAFYGQSWGYQIYFNNHRSNRYKIGGKPIDILRQEAPEVSEGVLNLQPILLDKNIHLFTQAGYDASDSIT